MDVMVGLISKMPAAPVIGTITLAMPLVKGPITASTPASTRSCADRAAISAFCASSREIRSTRRPCAPPARLKASTARITPFWPDWPLSELRSVSPPMKPMVPATVTKSCPEQELQV
jgi:hypothetical protein